MMYDDKSDYDLTIEILVDRPHSSYLRKGDICKAAIDPHDSGGYAVLCEKAPNGDYLIGVEQAKVL